MNFNPDDVRKVARAIGSGTYVDENCGMNAREICGHCGASRYHDWNAGDKKPFPHKLDCVVLIARDLLT